MGCDSDKVMLHFLSAWMLHKDNVYYTILLNNITTTFYPYFLLQIKAHMNTILDPPLALKLDSWIISCNLFEDSGAEYCSMWYVFNLCCWVRLSCWFSSLKSIIQLWPVFYILSLLNMIGYLETKIVWLIKQKLKLVLMRAYKHRLSNWMAGNDNVEFSPTKKLS